MRWRYKKTWYVDLGDIDLNYATLSKVTTVASHALVFLIQSIVNPFKFSIANFATDGISAPELFPLLWKAISICEKSSLKVIVVTCDELMLLIINVIYLVILKKRIPLIYFWCSAFFKNCKELFIKFWQW